MSDYILNDDGTAVYEFDDFTRALKRPTLRQYRELIEALGALRDDVLERTAAGEQVKVTVQLDLVIGWFDTVFASLAGEGLPRTPEGEIDEDRLPSWLLNGEVIGDLVTHWQTNPSHRGAR